MEKSIQDDEYYSLLNPLVESMGFTLIEAKHQMMKSGLKVRLVIYSPEGVGIDDCTQVFRAVRPRIEMELDDRDLDLEVSSPGLGRKLKSIEEFAVFQGLKARILVDQDWVSGKISAADEKSLSLETKEGIKVFNYADVKKGRLE